MAIGIGRREFISVLGGTALAWPLAACAQQEDIGILAGGGSAAGMREYRFTMRSSSVIGKGVDK
jgi:hypothetical protein